MTEFYALWAELTPPKRRMFRHLLRLLDERRVAPGVEVDAEIETLEKAFRKGRTIAVPMVH